MIDADRKPFVDMLVATLEVYGGKASRDATGIWWAALARYSIDEVRAAFSAHVQDPQRGRFTPKPADIIAALVENDGRPTADEAWSDCPLSEAQTTVWTEETKAAFFEAAYRLLEEDRIAARMAFKSAYDRHVGQARRAMRPIKWAISLGHDAESRRPVLERALEMRRLTHNDVGGLLPAPVAPRGLALVTNTKIGRTID